jgi:hypothetical protein
LDNIFRDFPKDFPKLMYISDISIDLLDLSLDIYLDLLKIVEYSMYLNKSMDPYMYPLSTIKRAFMKEFKYNVFIIDPDEMLLLLILKCAQLLRKIMSVPNRHFVPI